MRLRTFLIVAGGFVATIAAMMAVAVYWPSLLTGGPGRVDSQRRDDLNYFLSLYGAPDKQESTEGEVPRPQVVVHSLVYKKERVTVNLVADVSPRTAPPYDRWKLLSIQDSETNRPLSSEEVTDRMKDRKR